MHDHILRDRLWELVTNWNALMTAEELQHIKGCAQCERAFIEMVNERTEGGSDQHNNSDST
ncbi:MAG TPA: hypothetical protein VKY31_00315 [Terriglobia bacterium]|nr:hypothetical protein [Terriglobia bacterium]